MAMPRVIDVTVAHPLDPQPAPGNLRSALIVSATIPFALCIAVLIMTIRGQSANLLSAPKTGVS